MIDRLQDVVPGVVAVVLLVGWLWVNNGGTMFDLKPAGATVAGATAVTIPPDVFTEGPVQPELSDVHDANHAPPTTVTRPDPSMLVNDSAWDNRLTGRPIIDAGLLTGDRDIYDSLHVHSLDAEAVLSCPAGYEPPKSVDGPSNGCYWVLPAESANS